MDIIGVTFSEGANRRGVGYEGSFDDTNRDEGNESGV